MALTETTEKKTADEELETTEPAPQTEEETPEEQEEQSPSASGGSAEPAAKPKHRPKRPEKDEVRYNTKMRIYKMQKLSRKYNKFSMKYNLRDPAVREEQQKEMQEDKDKISQYQLLVAEKRSEEGVSTFRLKLMDELDAACLEASNRISEGEDAMADGAKVAQILEVYDEADTALVNVERDPDRYKTVAGYAELMQFLHQLMAKRGRVGPVHDLPQSEEKAAMLDQTMDQLSAYAFSFRKEMDPKQVARSEKLVAKRENLQAKQDRLNKQYTEKTPIIRLIRTAMKVDAIGGAAKKEGKDPVDIVDEHIMGNVIDAGDDIAKFATGDDESSFGSVLAGFSSKALKTAIKVLKGNISLEEGEKVDAGCGAVFGFLMPVWKGYIALRNIKSYLKESKDMSPDEKTDKQIEIVGSSFEAVISLYEPILEVLQVASEIPFIGSLIGFCNDAVSALIQIIKWDTNAGRRDDAKEKKEAVKTAMVAKKEKYKADSDLKSEGLLGFAGNVTDSGYFTGKQTTSAHLQKKGSGFHSRRIQGPLTGTVEEQEAGLETSVGSGTSGNIYARMAELKKKKMESEEGLTGDEKKEYYKMKSLRMVRDYKALDEASYVNKKRIQSGAAALVHIAVDVAKNISDLCPGIGSLLAKIMGLTNVGSKYAHIAFTKVKQFGRDKGMWGDGSKTTAAKDAKRSGMAKAMYDQMLFVGGYLNPNPGGAGGTFARLDAETGDQVEKRADFLRAETADLGYAFSKMLNANNKETLLDKMASAFSRKG